MTSAAVVLTPRTMTSRACDSLVCIVSTYEPFPPLTYTRKNNHHQKENKTKTRKRKANKTKTSKRSQLSCVFTIGLYPFSFYYFPFVSTILSFTISLFTLPLLIFAVIARSAGRNRFCSFRHTFSYTLYTVFSFTPLLFWTLVFAFFFFLLFLHRMDALYKDDSVLIVPYPFLFMFSSTTFPPPSLTRVVVYLISLPPLSPLLLFATCYMCLAREPAYTLHTHFTSLKNMKSHQKKKDNKKQKINRLRDGMKRIELVL